MGFSLFPREEKFFEFFKEQAKLNCEAARLLLETLKDYDRGDLEDKVRKISDLEHRGDEFVQETLIKLYKTFLTPIDREDIHELTNYLDDILDYIHSVAMKMKYFNVNCPTPGSIEMAEIIISATDLLRDCIEKLPCFEDISPLRRNIKELERRGDLIYRSSQGELFNCEGEAADFRNLLKWREIYQSLETAIDKCEDVFDVLEGIVLKNS